MDADLLDKIVADRSSSVTYELRVQVDNGRLTQAERRRVAETVERQMRAFQVQITMMTDGKSSCQLVVYSSSTGITKIDIGQEN